MPQAVTGRDPDPSRLWSLARVLALLVAALALGLLAGCGGDDDSSGSATTTETQVETETETTETETAAETETTPPGEIDPAAIFTDEADPPCASCHTFAAAGATGTVGPSLDTSVMTQEQIAQQIEMPAGPMPSFAGQLSQQEIDAVAQYVFENRTG
jgi:mono/diheme cytochrome c family protein